VPRKSDRRKVDAMLSTLTLMLFLGAAKVDTSGVILVRGGDGWGQVCAIDSKHAWTAKHVTTERSFFGISTVRPMIFATHDDEQGTVIQIYSDKRRDLAMVEAVVGEFSYFYALAAAAPKRGDRVTLVGIDDDYLPKRVIAKVRSVVAGSIIYDDTPGFGSSGSCVLNADGLLVGINTFGKIDGTGGWLRGGSWALYGTWSQIPERFKVEPAKEETDEDPKPTLVITEPATAAPSLRP